MARLTAQDWEAAVTKALSDPDQGPFLASSGNLFVLAGGHTQYSLCWCMPAMVPHGDHFHPEHRERMD
jgi:hypothetical protein